MLENAIQMFIMHHIERNDLKLKHALALNQMKLEHALLESSLIDKQQCEFYDLSFNHIDYHFALICVVPTEYPSVQMLLENENSFDQEDMVLSNSEIKIKTENSYIEKSYSELNEVSFKIDHPDQSNIIDYSKNINLFKVPSCYLQSTLIIPNKIFLRNEMYINYESILIDKFSSMSLNS